MASRKYIIGSLIAVAAVIISVCGIMAGLSAEADGN